MTALDRTIAFDRATGVIRAEAGASVDALLRLVVPQGWFLPVTPGTRFVTLAGAVANDVHGKNHHAAGTLGRHVRRLALLRTDGTRHEIGPDDASGLFAATIGGLGLTGVIEWVELQLMPIRSASIETMDVPFGHVREFFDLSGENETRWPYTVAWIDCLSRGTALGRGIFSCGRHAESGSLTPHGAGPKLKIPFDAPSVTLNRLSIAAFNTAYFHLKRLRAGRRVVHYAPFFYPLDSIGQWNRLYGRRGFYQYQCQLPPGPGPAAIEELIRQISAAGDGSFLAVLKTFGALPSPGLLSFPSEGVTLALDFRNRDTITLALLDRLDAVVREAGGRLYPAKDGRMSGAMFQQGYPRWQQFKAFLDPGLSSDFWKRVSS